MNPITVNPLQTTNGLGSFNTTSDGYIVGNAMPDPSARFALSGGRLSTSDPYPMWGGVGISEVIATPGVSNPSTSLGNVIARGTGLADCTGISVFDQNYAAINTPQSPVPMTPGGGLVNFFRFGSRIRIPVAMDPALVTLEGQLITTQVGWNFDISRLCTYVAAFSTFNATSVTASGAQATFNGSGMPVLPVGSSFNVSVSPGSALNGNWTVVSSSSSTLVATSNQYPAPTAQASATIAAGGGAFPVKILDIDVGNSMIPSYAAATGFCTWTKNGAAALVLL